MPGTASAPPASGRDDSIGWKLEVGALVSFLFACFAVSLRVFARAKHARIGWDDWLMLFALVQALASTIVDFVAVDAGIGRHMAALTPPERAQQLLLSFIAQLFCVDALTFAKLSIIGSYLRILSGSRSKLLKYILYMTAFLVFAVNTVVVVSFFVQCSPAQRSWDRRVSGTCWRYPTEMGFILLQGSFSAFTDFLLCFFPVFLFKNLQVSTKVKCMLLGLMGLGGVTGALAIVRTVEAYQELSSSSADVSCKAAFSDHSQLLGGHTNSSIDDTVLGLTWAALERNFAIMLGSIPAINPLFKPMSAYLSKTFSRRSHVVKSNKGSFELRGESGQKRSGVSESNSSLSNRSEALA